MNFDYIKEAEPSTDDLRQLYDSLYQNLEKAEELYWTKPQRCGMMLRKATEKICRDPFSGECYAGRLSLLYRR